MGSNGGNDDLRYEVRILIRHPSLNASVISERLGIEAQNFATAGEPRLTPTGTRLAGVWRETWWGHHERFEAERYFFRGLMRKLELLEEHQGFVSELIADGGSVELIVNLPGDTNIGDSLSWKSLEKLARLKINLGLEVFPNFSD